jgi:vitamin B12/bleomycin/antimicrobial peptide transport system ATP-binding/permease protein
VAGGLLQRYRAPLRRDDRLGDGRIRPAGGRLDGPRRGCSSPSRCACNWAGADGCPPGCSIDGSLTPGITSWGSSWGDHANPDQRIADDARIACEAIVDLGAGAFNALLMFGCFIGVLWNLSGTLLVPLGAGFHVDGYMVWAALLYAAIGTGLTTLVGRPLARLSAAKLAAEGVYRSDLVRVNENAEGIALMGGERDERHTLNRLFDALADRWVTLRRGTCNVAWLTTGFSLTGLIFPALVASPLYLAGDMTMGGLMQAVAAMVHVQTALSWAVTNFARIADLRASAARITALVDVLDAIDADRVDPHADRIVTRTGAREELRIVALDIAYPDGTIVITGATETIKPGEKVLVAGESGAGKSTLLRAIAGVWPWGRGTIEWPPDGRMMFLPQRPYFPTATLAAALAYPLEPDAFPDDVYRAVLERCGIGSLASRLERELSLGSRPLGRRPAAPGLRARPPPPAALGVPGRSDIGARRGRPDGADAPAPRGTSRLPPIVSTGDRPGLEILHDRTMTLVKGEDSTRLVRGARPARALDAAAAAAAATPPPLVRLRRLVTGA